MVKAIVVLYFVLFAFLICRRTGYSLAGLMVCYLGLEQWAQSGDSFFGQHPAFLNYASVALVGLGVVVAFAKGERPLSVSPTWSMVAFYVFACASYLWSISRPSTTMVIGHAAPYVVAFMILLPLTLNSIEDIRRAVIGVLFAGVAVLLMLLLTTQELGGRGVELAEGAVNRYGRDEAKGSALSMGELGGMVVLCAATIRFSGLSKWLMLLLRWAAIGVGMAAVFRSGSRGQMLGVAALLPIVMILSSASFRIHRLVMACVGIVFVFFIGWWAISFIPENTLGRWTVENSIAGFGHRLTYMSEIMAKWSKAGPIAWLLGLGLGASWSIYETYPHNIPVQILGETGVVGLVLYLHFMGLAVYYGFRLFRRYANNPEARSVVVAFGALMGYSFILSLKQGGLSGIHGAWIYPLILCRVESLTNLSYHRKRAAGRRMATEPSTLALNTN